MSERFLEDRKQACTSRKSNRHRAEFTDHFVPVFCSNPTLICGNRVQDLVEALGTMRRERYRFVDGVQEPPQYDLFGIPTSIPFAQFFERRWFLSKHRIIPIQRTEDFVQGVKENALDGSSLPLISLDESTKIIHINIPILERTKEGLGG